jgi:hypothetical protein
MFMWSITFVIVCGLFEWNQIYAGFFYSLFIYVFPLEIQLSIGECLDPINLFNSATALCLSQAKTWMFNFMSCVQLVIWEGDCSFC